jgi:Sec63 Brl domain.
MKQIEQVGVVTVRKLAAAGITSIEGLECVEAHQIEMVLSKNPPFGSKLLSRLKEFPKLRVSVKMLGKVCYFARMVNAYFSNVGYRK